MTRKLEMGDERSYLGLKSVVRAAFFSIGQSLFYFSVTALLKYVSLALMLQIQSILLEKLPFQG